jgi:hypothetical protein
VKHPHGNYRNDENNVLLSTFNVVCEDLGIADADQTQRDRVAGILMSLANSGQHNSELLKTHAIEQFEGAR